MNKRYTIAWVVLIACVIVLFGSLFWTLLTNNGWPFIIGYPVAFVLLFVAQLLRPVSWR